MKILKTFCAAALGAALVPMAAVADDTAVTATQMQAVRSAIAAVGCVVDTQSAAASVETFTGYDQDRLALIVEALRATGEIVDIDDGEAIRLTSGVCAN